MNEWRERWLIERGKPRVDSRDPPPRAPVRNADGSGSAQASADRSDAVLESMALRYLGPKEVAAAEERQARITEGMRKLWQRRKGE